MIRFSTFAAVPCLALATSSGVAQTIETPQARTPLVAQGRGTVALVNANVLPMDREGDTLLAGQTVLIRDGIIQQVGPRSRVRIPAGATRIEARGKYLMPGLADMHVHIVGPRALQEELLKMYVVAGVTPILNMRGTPEHLALRADIRAGRVLGPTMY